MLKIVTDEVDRDDLAGTLDELVTEGAQRMLIAALETEVAGYIESCEELVDEAGYRLVVGNGRAAGRTLVTGAGRLSTSAADHGGPPLLPMPSFPAFPSIRVHRRILGQRWGR